MVHKVLHYLSPANFQTSSWAPCFLCFSHCGLLIFIWCFLFYGWLSEVFIYSGCKSYIWDFQQFSPTLWCVFSSSFQSLSQGKHFNFKEVQLMFKWILLLVLYLRILYLTQSHTHFLLCESSEQLFSKEGNFDLQRCCWHLVGRGYGFGQTSCNVLSRISSTEQRFIQPEKSTAQRLRNLL